MITKTRTAAAQQEQLIRKASEVGNGAHIFVPKEWINEQVILIRTPKKPLEEQILELLCPYLKDVVAVFLYGSYARGEQAEDSDIDILVVSDKKFSIKKEKFDISVVTIENLEKSIKFNPVMFYSMIKEAKPIINSYFLKQLQARKPKLYEFSEFISSTKDLAKINQKAIEIDRLSGEKTADPSTIYSLILRLRGTFIISQLLKGRAYSKKGFENWLLSNLPGIDYEKIYKIYRAVRDDKKVSEKVKIEESESLLKLLKKEIKKLQK
jgi:predicted nucleotidyltransferase